MSRLDRDYLTRLIAISSHTTTCATRDTGTQTCHLNLLLKVLWVLSAAAGNAIPAYDRRKKVNSDFPSNPPQLLRLSCLDEDQVSVPPLGLTYYAS